MASRLICALLLLIVPLAAQEPEPPKPKFVEDKVLGHPNLTGHHWACPKNWMVSGGGDKPIVCVPETPVDPNAVRVANVEQPEPPDLNSFRVNLNPRAIDPRYFRAAVQDGTQKVPKSGIVKVTFPPFLQRARCTATYEPQAKYLIEFQEGPNAQITQVDGFTVKAHSGLTLKWHCWGIVRVSQEKPK